jgi:hypothetical protein
VVVDLPKAISTLHFSVNTVVEIEKALRTLPVEEARKIADWLEHYLAEKWDKQIDDDLSAGRLDKLADKALGDYRAGRVKPLDEITDQP